MLDLFLQNSHNETEDTVKNVDPDLNGLPFAQLPRVIEDDPIGCCYNSSS